MRKKKVSSENNLVLRAFPFQVVAFPLKEKELKSTENENETKITT